MSWIAGNVGLRFLFLDFVYVLLLTQTYSITFFYNASAFPKLLSSTYIRRYVC